MGVDEKVEEGSLYYDSKGYLDIMNIAGKAHHLFLNAEVVQPHAKVILSLTLNYLKQARIGCREYTVELNSPSSPLSAEQQVFFTLASAYAPARHYTPGQFTIIIDALEGVLPLQQTSNMNLAYYFLNSEDNLKHSQERRAYKAFQAALPQLKEATSALSTYAQLQYDMLTRKPDLPPLSPDELTCA